MISGKRSPARSKSRASATTVWQISRRYPRVFCQATVERLEKLWIPVERRDPITGPREIQGDAARARADVEHGVAVLSRQRAPQRQVLGVGAALEVVPDHAHRRPTGSGSQNLTAWPRAASSSRSSSSAVYVGSAYS